MYYDTDGVHKLVQLGDIERLEIGPLCSIDFHTVAVQEVQLQEIISELKQHDK